MNSSPSSSRSADRLRAVAYPLFFASGAAALIYEIVWTRMLITVFGAGIYAVSAVLSAFMAGLALGSALIGRSSDRLRHPLRFYALLETAIACAGFALPFLIHKLGAVDDWAYSRLGQNFAALTSVRFAASFLLMLIPTTLMGATLPALATALVRGRGRLGMRVGELYAVNTAGAVVGAFVAGFYLLERFGVTQTAFTAAILNAIAAMGAYCIAGVHNPPEAESDGEASQASPDPSALESRPAPASAPSDPALIRLVLFSAFATGLVSMGAQVIWSRTLVFSFEHLKNTTYAFSAMLTVFLSGLALGSAVAGWIADRQANPARLYGIIIALVGVSMAQSLVPLYRESGLGFLPNPVDVATQTMNWPLAVGNIMAQTALVLGVPTFLLGMAFPIAARAVATSSRVGSDVGRLYALNTAGAIIGPIAASFVIIPALGMTRALLAIAAAECALGLYVIWRAPAPRRAFRLVAPLCVAGFVAIIASIPRGRGMQALIEGEQIVFHDEGPMATVTVVKNNFGYNTIYIDGVGVAGTDPMLQTDQKSLAHLPMLLVENPRAALTVGFGSGGASYSYLLHDRLEHVHCAEICPQVPQAAPTLSDANHGFLAKGDPRYKIIYDDARAYLRHTKQNYDIIATDCTDLRYKSNANLYDLEYFQFCRARLSPGGAVVVWMPLAGLSDSIFRVALRTFHRVFPEMAVFFMDNEPTHYILLVGWRDKMEIDFARIAERLKEPDVKADLAELHLDDPVKILSTWIIGGEPLDRYLAGDVINTEDMPVIEFESPKYGYADKPILDNLASMMALRNSSRDFLKPGGASEADIERLKRYEQAMPLIVEGHGHYRRLDIEEAAMAYLKALHLTPEDPSLPYLLDFRELRLSAKRGSAWAWLRLGKAYELRGMDDMAATCYERASQAALGGARDRSAIAESAQASLQKLRERLQAPKAP